MNSDDAELKAGLEGDIVRVGGGQWSYDLCLPNRLTDYIQGKIAESGQAYELDMLLDMASRLVPGSVVLDVGANVGNHTIFLSAVRGCRVVAFEPNESLCRALRVSIEVNGLTELVRLEQVGVGAYRARGVMDHLDEENLGAQSIAFRKDGGDFDVVSLDEIVTETVVDAIKVDVEGMELDVVRGAESLIRRLKPLLYIECQNEDSFREVRAFVHNIGYRYRESFNVTLTHLFEYDEEDTAERRLDELLLREVVNQYRYGRDAASLRESLREAQLKYRVANERVAALKRQLEDATKAQRSWAAAGVLGDQLRGIESRIDAVQSAIKREVASHQPSVDEVRAIARYVQKAQLEFHDAVAGLAVPLLAESIRASKLAEFYGSKDVPGGVSTQQGRRGLRHAIKLAALGFRKSCTAERSGWRALVKTDTFDDPSRVVRVDGESVCVEATGDEIAAQFLNQFSRIQVWLEGMTPDIERIRPAIFLEVSDVASLKGSIGSWKRNRRGEWYHYLPVDGTSLVLELPVASRIPSIRLVVRASISGERLPSGVMLRLSPGQFDRALDSLQGDTGKSGRDQRLDALNPDNSATKSTGWKSLVQDDQEFLTLSSEWISNEAMPISSDWIYEVVLPCWGPEAHERAGVLSVRFHDERGELIDGPYVGWHNSSKFGPYRYISVSGSERDLAFKLRPPTQARSVRLALYKWKVEGVRFRPPSVDRICPLPEEQERQSRRAVYDVLKLWNDTDTALIVLDTTTKPIGERHRANRPMQFAIEYAAQGHHVIYVYHRFTEQEAVPVPVQSNLIQIPNDHLNSLESAIAFAEGNDKKYYLSSIPDYHSVHHCSAFKSAGWRVVYEARDDWEEFQNHGVGGWYHPLFERYLALHADGVTAVSAPLIKKMQVFGAAPMKCRVIPNGAAAAFVEQGVAERARRRSGTSGTKVGYFGHLTDKWFDWTLLISAAQLRPKQEFEIIGFDPPRDLDLPANLVLLDAMPHGELIKRARTWEVALVPFKPSILTSAVDPIKVHEYLAIGLKCVSVFMPQIEDYPGTLTYRGREDFIETLDRAVGWKLEEHDWQAIEAHVASAQWRLRANDTLSFVDGLIR